MKTYTCHASFSRTAVGAHQRGFSLIEIALVLVIVGLALGGIAAALGPQLENKKISDTQNRIKEASDAIMAFAMVNGRLPCPAAPPAGVAAANRGTSDPANPGRGLCVTFEGFVPARTLGLGEQGVGGASEGLIQDAWGFGLRYRVARVVYTGAGNQPAPVDCSGPPANSCFPLTQANGIRNAYYTPAVVGPPAVAAVVTPIPAAGQLQICNTSLGIAPAACSGPATTLAQAVFIVWSTGRNGSDNGAAVGGTTGTRGADEDANLVLLANDVTYVSHERRDVGGAGGAFDDIFLWTPAITLTGSMIRAGVLP
ncbi:MAG: type II secretion system protein [Polaromonas sp.]|uniref:type II secretion system protein n=1 Tax=Polaromonas sp. TaxID=1869339 RepID=UPI002487D2C4|nr:type II secretion system protein [Polaromonas sp.]MDI1238576.1 type II secretion system protein [Polaromonas sp.]